MKVFHASIERISQNFAKCRKLSGKSGCQACLLQMCNLVLELGSEFFVLVENNELFMEGFIIDE